MATASNQILIQGLIELHMSGAGGKEAAHQIEKLVTQAKLAEKGIAGVGTATATTATQVGLLDSAFLKLGATIGSFIAAGAIANFLKTSYLGFAQTERAALATERQIASLGQAVEGAGFRQFIAQLSATSGILDDELIPAFQRAFGAFKNYASAADVVTIASKFAAAGIGDVGSNVEAISRFFQTGQTRGLAQFGINIKGAADGTLDLATGFRELESAADSLSGGFDDAQTKINATKVLVDQFSDSVGGLIEKIADLTLKYSLSPLAQAARARAGLTGEDASIFGPTQESAASKQAREEQVKRDAEANKKKADEKVKAEAEALKKIKDLNAQNQQELIEQVLDQYEVGTQERLNLEIELNERLRVAAVENAKQIGADVAVVNALFAEKARKDREAFVNATLPAPGSGGESDESKRTREAREEAIKRQIIAADEAFAKKQIRDQELEWDEERARMHEAIILDSASKATGLLLSAFGQHKAAAIGQLAIDTASAVMQVWADPLGGPWYVKLAKTVALGAIAHQQLQQIQSASPAGGSIGTGGAGGGGGAPQIANQPTAPAQQGNQNAVFVAPMSGTQAATMAGMSGGGNVLIVNVDKAFGNDKAMNQLARDIQRRVRFSQWELR